MAKQQPSLYTTSEEIENLKKTNQVSVVKVFVEGPDDFKIFSSIAKHKDLGERVEISNRGGRIALLELQEEYLLQKSEIRRQVVFFADQDTWVFTGIPEKYREVHFTKGYSIENDLFEDGQIAIDQLLFPAEKVRLESLIDQISDWFAKEVQLILKGEAQKANIDISFLNPTILVPNALELHETYKVSPSTDEEIELSKQIKQNYRQFLRGKFLFELLQRISKDRGSEESLPLPSQSPYFFFNTCIATGLNNNSSNCHRIAALLQNTLNSTPPII